MSNELGYCQTCNKYTELRELGIVENFGADMISVSYHLCEKCLDRKQREAEEEEI